MQNYNFVKNDVFVAKICKYALYESSEGLFCAPRKAANFCHPDKLYIALHYMLAKFGTNSGGITWWSNFELIQVEPHTIGQIWNQCKWNSI